MMFEKTRTASYCVVGINAQGQEVSENFFAEVPTLYGKIYNFFFGKRFKHITGISCQ